MSVLVTGGAGYIGSHMVLALVEAGESVVVVDNLSTGFSTSLPDGVPLFIGDAGDENLVEGVIAAHDVKSIIHFAGSVVVPDSIRDPLAYYRNNTMTTRSLLKAAIKSGVNQFIFSSTAAVYGNPDKVPVPEEAPTRPLSPYGVGKLAAEDVSHQILEARGVPFTATRFFNTYGPGQTYTPYVGVLTIFITPLKTLPMLFSLRPGRVHRPKCGGAPQRFSRRATCALRPRRRLRASGFRRRGSSARRPRPGARSRHGC